MLNPFKPLELIKAEVGPDRQTLYITEALSGDILTARMPVAGKLMYGLQ